MAVAGRGCNPPRCRRQSRKIFMPRVRTPRLASITRPPTTSSSRLTTSSLKNSAIGPPLNARALKPPPPSSTTARSCARTASSTKRVAEFQKACDRSLVVHRQTRTESHAEDDQRSAEPGAAGRGPAIQPRTESPRSRRPRRTRSHFKRSHHRQTHRQVRHGLSHHRPAGRHQRPV